MLTPEQRAALARLGELRRPLTPTEQTVYHMLIQAMLLETQEKAYQLENFKEKSR